jgi:prolyl oligopeptidase
MPASESPIAYPHTPTVECSDNYHGTSVRDPYRWLEDRESASTQAWIEAQNQLTFDYFSAIPQRPSIEQRLSQLWHYDQYRVPFKRGHRYFYRHNDGRQNQSVLYALEELEAEPRVLLDPNPLASDGTVALTGLAVSDDGELMAYGLSTGGSDWKTWYVRDVATGEDFSDRLDWIKFSGASWTPDKQGFFYSGYPAPSEAAQLEQANYFQKLYYHRLGTAQAEDRCICERPDRKEWLFDGEVTEDGHYLIITVWQGTDPRNLVFYRDLQNPDAGNIELISQFEAAYEFVGNDGSLFWFRTDLHAPRGRLIAIDVEAPARSQWQEIVPEGQGKLEGATLLNDRFAIEYLEDACSAIAIYERDGTFVRSLQLPGIGSVSGFSGQRYDTETFYAFESFTSPPTIYRYDLARDESHLFRAPTLDFNPQNYETRQVFYSSKDGTQVPMFVTYKKGVLRNASNPLFLFGYGGFGISLTPSFAISRLVWLEMGGVLAVPNLRGGGEYGERWHQAGTKHNKQTVFDDFIAAAEWAIANGYTTAQKLAMGGGSNGGLLVGACLAQRPDLFAAALPAVGVMDMLRFHRFTIGWAWCSDYGSPDDPSEFRTLYAYSPLHNLQPGTAYPATLITTADRDDRVVPAHSFKFAAALQAAQAGSAPVLIRIETQAGHGAGKPTSKQIEEAADRWAFLAHTLAVDASALEV